MKPIAVTPRHSLPQLDALNLKIEEYNLSRFRQTGEPGKKDERFIQLSLLQEMNHMVNQLKVDQINTPKKSSDYFLLEEALIEFDGIGQELEKFNYPPLDGALADHLLTRALDSPSGLPSLADWNKTIKSTGVFGALLSKKNIQGERVGLEIQALNEEKGQLNQAELTPEKNAENCERYYYHLTAFKQMLLKKICFELKDGKNIQQFRHLLSQINHEITRLEPLVAHINRASAQTDRMAQLPLLHALCGSQHATIERLMVILKSPEAINPGPPTKADLVQILPSLASFAFTKIGHANNITWKLDNEEEGLSLIVQIQPPESNQALLADLKTTPCGQYFATEYYSSKFREASAFRLKVTECVEKGDIRNERESMQDASESSIIGGATSKLIQLTDFCRILEASHLMHPDIKLTNFLTDNQGNLIISDKKALRAINSEGFTDSISMITTRSYAPPEYSDKSKREYNAEKFMTYQIGLALYDYLLLPTVSDKSEEGRWYQKNPLDFNHSLFRSPEGQAMKVLISEMTDPDPNKRPTLERVKLILKAIHQSNDFNQASVERLGGQAMRTLIEEITDPDLNKRPTLEIAQVTLAAIEQMALLEEAQTQTLGADISGNNTTNGAVITNQYRQAMALEREAEKSPVTPTQDAEQAPRATGPK